MENIEQTLHSIEKTLASIELLLRKMPEMQAATFIKMNEEYQRARLQGKSCDDLWEFEQTPKKPDQDVEDPGQANEIEISVRIAASQLSQAVLEAIRGKE